MTRLQLQRLHEESRSCMADEPVLCEEREDGGRSITGYAAVYYRKDDPGTEYTLWSDSGSRAVERLMPGAFSSALERKDDVRALFNHDSNLVLGRVSAGTLALSINRRGLMYTIDAPDTQLGRDTVTSIKRGDVTGSSFAFRVLKEAWRDEGDGQEVREIQDVELFDVSPVTWPAYTSTTSQVRGVDYAREMRDLWREATRQEDETERKRKEFERWLLAKCRLQLLSLSQRSATFTRAV